MPQIEEFESYKIKEASIQFKDESAVSFGCVGTLDVSSNIEKVEKKCEGRTVKTVKKITDMTVAVTAHVKVAVNRKLSGLKSTGLKTGVYGYGSESFSAPFVFTAKVLDMDGNVKYIAFPNLENVKGLSLKVNNDVTEIEMDDMEFSALVDSEDFYYYEAFESEITDENVKTRWLTNFTPELVKQSQ